MKNKNLILAIFILGIVLMSSIAFATTSTGYMIRKSLWGEKRVPVQIEMPTQVSQTAGTATGHTHLSDYEYVMTNLSSNATFSKFIVGQIDCSQFGSDYVALGGGYYLNNGIGNLIEYYVYINGPVSLSLYRVEIYNDGANQNLFGKIYATCARVEPTLHQFSQDY